MQDFSCKEDLMMTSGDQLLSVLILLSSNETQTGSDIDDVQTSEQTNIWMTLRLLVSLPDEQERPSALSLSLTP